MFKGSQLFTVEVGGRTLALEAGLLAPQAGGAVTVRYGDTVLLSTATMSKDVRPGINFFPLTVEFEERLYAAGRIPGSFFRREGRPSEQAILMSRLVDRPLRPLFPKGMRNEVQVIITAMSTDGQSLMDPLAIIAGSAALAISDIPWNGPIAGTTIGFVDG
ncbi:MAG: polyribonucleotide nucleotidyltransferase, partial [Caldilineaceae bacterium]|nr:polyribonucleotide nucleotidyltransferase [Caldilineaceae bacterium]